MVDNIVAAGLPRRDRIMKRYFFEALSFILLAGSIVFFHQTVAYLSKRDYIASLILMLIGLSVMRVGSEMARLALIDRR